MVVRVTPSQQKDLADDVLQFSHVAGPSLVLQKGDGFGPDRSRIHAYFATRALHEIFHPVGDVFGALT